MIIYFFCDIVIELVEIAFVAEDLLVGEGLLEVLLIFQPQLRIISMPLIFNIALQKALRYAEEQFGVDRFELTVVEESADAVDGFVELEGLNTKQNIILPYLKAPRTALECLLTAVHPIKIPLLLDVAIRQVGPGFGAAVVYCDEGAKTVSCTLPIFYAHVGASFGEPAIFLQFVHC